MRQAHRDSVEPRSPSYGDVFVSSTAGQHPNSRPLHVCNSVKNCALSPLTNSQQYDRYTCIHLHQMLLCMHSRMLVSITASLTRFRGPFSVRRTARRRNIDRWCAISQDLLQNLLVQYQKPKSSFQLHYCWHVDGSRTGPLVDYQK